MSIGVPEEVSFKTKFRRFVQLESLLRVRRSDTELRQDAGKHKNFEKIFPMLKEVDRHLFFIFLFFFFIGL